MPTSLVTLCSAAAYATSNNAFTPFPGSTQLALATTSEPFTAIVMPVAVTASGLTCAQGPYSGTFSGQLRKNSANANQSISNSAPTSAASDSYNVGDTMVLRWGPPTTAQIQRVQMILTSASQMETIYGTSGAASGVAAGATVYIRLFGAGNSTVASAAQTWCGAPGYLQNATFNVSANATTAISVFGIFTTTSGVVGINIAAGLTGTFTDTTGQPQLSADDKYCAQVNNGGGGTISYWLVGVGFVNPTADAYDTYAYTSVGLAAGATMYQPLAGYPVAGFTTEATAQAAHGFALTISGQQSFFYTNSANGNININSRVNGANGKQGGPIGAGMTGWMIDTVNSDVLGPTDLTDTIVTNTGTSGTVNIMFIGYVETNAPVGGATWNEAVSEAGSAADTTSSTSTSTNSVTEAGAALDAVSATLRIGVSVTEAGSATDTVGAQEQTTLSVSETGNATDAVGSMTRMTLSVAETGNAVDSADTGTTAPPSEIIETGNAADVVMAVVEFQTVVNEVGDATDAVVIVWDEYVIEAGSAADAPDAQVEFNTQTDEAGSAADGVLASAPALVVFPYAQVLSMTARVSRAAPTP